MWRWLTHVETMTPAGKQILWLNLDETSVAVHFLGGRGTVVTDRTPGGLASKLGVRASKAALRGAVTHVGLICDNSTLQPLLPQVIIGNRRRFTRKLLAAVATSKPSGVHLFAEKSAWNSHDIMVRVLRLLAEALEPYKAIWQPVLMLDVATCHVGPKVAAAARSLGIQLVYVPARMTGLLQPLDVAVFASYKAWLRTEWRRLQEAAPQGQVSDVAWLELVMKAASTFLRSKKWHRAFELVGVGGRSNISTAISRQAPEALATPLVEGPPTTGDIELIFPRGRCQPLTSVVTFPAPLRRRRTKGPGLYA